MAAIVAKTVPWVAVKSIIWEVDGYYDVQVQTNHTNVSVGEHKGMYVSAYFFLP